MNRIDALFSYFSSNLLLFMTCAGIWGSTWLTIKFQLGTHNDSNPDPVISVFYRFLISTILLFSFATLMKKRVKFSKKTHLFFFAQGACNFSINYIFTYWAEQYAPSAIVATAFTLLVVYNILGMKLFFKRKIGVNVYLGALFGIIGILFIFGHELTSFKSGDSDLRGLGLGLVATLFASAGNLLSYKNHINNIPVTLSNAWGMLYGSITTLVIALIMHKPITFTNSPTYWYSLLYLSLFGTVIAFGAYLTLVGKIGAEKAAYVSVLSPMIAVILSALFENFKITSLMIVGLTFCLLGNILTIHNKSTQV